jgi:hypothetical protein
MGSAASVSGLALHGLNLPASRLASSTPTGGGDSAFIHTAVVVVVPSIGIYEPVLPKKLLHNVLIPAGPNFDV